MKATYMGSGDPARRRIDCYPVWLDNLGDDVTRERAAMEGAAQRAEAVRTIVVTARELYEHQKFNHPGPYGDNGFHEMVDGPLTAKTGDLTEPAQDRTGSTRTATGKGRQSPS